MFDKNQKVKEIEGLTGYKPSQIFEIRKNYFKKGIKAKILEKDQKNF